MGQEFGSAELADHATGKDLYCDKYATKRNGWCFTERSKLRGRIWNDRNDRNELFEPMERQNAFYFAERTMQVKVGDPVIPTTRKN